MLDKEYEIKADIARPKVVKKEPTVAITPTGTQYVGNIKSRLALLGLDLETAKKAGWRFK